MSSIVVAENLSKSYLLGHQSARRERYTALRDVIARETRNFTRKTVDFVRGRQIVQGDEVEQFWALRDVSFEVNQGEVLGIIGRNGAGKSTLLKILSRITEPDRGRAILRGRVASLLEIGTGFHPELTGRENIFLNGAILGMTKAEIKAKFDEIVAFAEVERFLDTPVKRYSSGMYVRLAFSIAAHLEPEILIVDEVLAVGDTEFQKKCLGKIRDVSRGGRTVLFVSHNLSALQTLCGSAILLDRGKLIAAGSPDEMVEHYTTGLRSEEKSPNLKALALGPDISLGQLEVRPKSPISGDPLAINLKLVPRQHTVVRELALLLYSSYGIRVAVLDLRPHLIRNLKGNERPIEFEVNIPALSLVDGDYRLGIYIVTNAYAEDYLDLASFNVRPRSAAQEIIPYPPQYRGLVELDFTVKQAASEMNDRP
jgi:lipopolysaccharide transport system ATP-binding protein